MNLHPDFGAFIDALVHQNVDFKVAGDLGGRRVFFLGKDAYIRNKRAVGRPKDLGDLELLGNL